jgi:hypothetical protein
MKAVVTVDSLRAHNVTDHLPPPERDRSGSSKPQAGGGQVRWLCWAVEVVTPVGLFSAAISPLERSDLWNFDLTAVRYLYIEWIKGRIVSTFEGVGPCLQTPV